MALSDFDLQTPTYINLDPGSFVSSPSSLRLRNTPGTPPSVLARPASLQCVRQGRVVTYTRATQSGIDKCLRVLFRALAPLGSAYKTGAYAAFIAPSMTQWGFFTSETAYTIIQVFPNPGQPSGTWTQFRISWWEGFDLLNQPATCFRAEWYNGGWVQLGSDAYDTNRLNESSPIQRVGLACGNGLASYYAWADDTEFWTDS